MDMQNLETQFEELKSQVDALSKQAVENKLSMVVFSGELDKVLAALVIATGAVAMGMEVVMFFTFWGTTVLRDKKKKGWWQRCDGQNVWCHVANRYRGCETFQYEYGRHGYRHDEIPDEKEKCGFPGRNAGDGRGTRCAHLRV
jgi:predicted peroxiredoxin